MTPTAPRPSCEHLAKEAQPVVAEHGVAFAGQEARIVEAFRNDVPEAARAAAEAAPDMFAPVRVIESVQEDGAVIYELFREGQPGEPAAEVKLADGKAEMLTERWAY